MNAGLLLSFSVMSMIGLMAGCTALDYGTTERNHTASLNCCTLQPGTAQQQAIARVAAKLVGARTIQTGNRIVSYDCAGVSRAIYLSQGHDLYEGSDGIVFFDNTWDFNEDGMLNDPLTHVGIVEEVERDGTVVFISRVSNAIERYRMNLHAPDAAHGADGRIVNDYLRRKNARDPRGTVYLTGQLFAGFGSLRE